MVKTYEIRNIRISVLYQPVSSADKPVRQPQKLLQRERSRRSSSTWWHHTAAMTQPTNSQRNHPQRLSISKCVNSATVTEVDRQAFLPSQILNRFPSIIESFRPPSAVRLHKKYPNLIHSACIDGLEHQRASINTTNFTDSPCKQTQFKLVRPGNDSPTRTQSVKLAS